ncbi:hypothetical protein Bca4012_008375 [Brassica carinata]
MPLSHSLLSRRFSISFRDLGAKTAPESYSHQSPPPPKMLPPPPPSGSAMLPELLGEIIRRVEESKDQWPQRRDVVSCACLSKKWREIAPETVRSPVNFGKITFPFASNWSKRVFKSVPDKEEQEDIKSSTFFLYLALTPAFTAKGKFLLAARRFRTGAYTEYIISLDADFSQGSNAYVGKLRSDFLGTNFTIYDRQPPHNGAKPSNGKASRRFASKQISPQVSAGNFEVGHVSYKFNLLKSRDGEKAQKGRFRVDDTKEQSSEMARALAMLVSELPRKSDRCFGQ